MKTMTRMLRLFINAVVLLALTLALLGNFICTASAETPTVYSEEELMSELASAIASLQKTITINFRYHFDGNKITFDDLIEQAAEINDYNAHMVYKYQYNYNQDSRVCTFRFSYYLNEKELKKVDDFAEEFAEELAGMTDYEKILYTHDYLIDNCEYVEGNDGPYRCLFLKKTNCNGYALAFQIIMEKAGVECKYVTGYNHAWNMVKINESWYSIDVTWDDNKEDRYKYFLCGKIDFEGHDRNTATAIVRYQDGGFNNIVNFLNAYWQYVLLLFLLSCLIFKVRFK